MANFQTFTLFDQGVVHIIQVIVDFTHNCTSNLWSFQAFVHPVSQVKLDAL